MLYSILYACILLCLSGAPPECLEAGVCVHTNMCAYIYIYIYIHIYTYIYIYIYTYTYIHIYRERDIERERFTP